MNELHDTQDELGHEWLGVEEVNDWMICTCSCGWAYQHPNYGSTQDAFIDHWGDHITASSLASNREQKAEIERLTEKLNRYPADWWQDSSLKTWFPFTAEEMDRLKAELASLRASAGGEKEFMQQNAKDIGALLKDAIYPGQKLENIYALIRHALIYVNLQLNRVAPPTLPTEKEK